MEKLIDTFLDKRLGGHQIRSGCFAEEKYPMVLPGIEQKHLGCQAPSLYTTCLRK